MKSCTPESIEQSGRRQNQEFQFWLQPSGEDLVQSWSSTTFLQEQCDKIDRQSTAKECDVIIIFKLLDGLIIKYIAAFY